MSGMNFSRLAPSREVAALVPTLLLCVGATTVPAQSTNLAASPVSRMLQASALPADAGAGYKYLGPGSCSAAACHGGIQGGNTTKVPEKENSPWIVQNPPPPPFPGPPQAAAKRMAEIL